MHDQAEEIRRRLEARGAKRADPAKPVTNSRPEFRPPPAPQPDRTQLDAIARQRTMEAASSDPTRAQPVVVVDVKIKFWSLVTLMVKVAFATIPAAIAVYAIWMFIVLVLGVIGGWLRH